MEQYDEVVRDLERRVGELSAHVDLSNEKVRSDIRAISSDVERLKEASPTFVTHDRYRPVERLVLGGAGLILIAVVTALVSIVVRSQ